MRDSSARLFALALAASLLAACGARSGLGADGIDHADAGTSSSSGGPTGRTLSASWSHSCAITSGGKVACWGQLNGAAPVLTPTVVEGITDAVEVATGQDIDCARRADGTAWCWGLVIGGTPQQVEGATFSSIVAGSGAVCGIASGGVRCAGSGFLAGSSCDMGASAWSPVSVPVASLSSVAGIAMGQWHACAFDTTGATSCWGCGNEGPPDEPWVLGSMSPNTATPIAVPGVNATTRIAGETETTCAVQADGSTECWGDGSQFGPGITFHPVGPTVATFPASPIDVDVGVTFSCAAYASEIQCLGGIPAFAGGCMDDVQALSIALAGAQEISVGLEHGCARDAEGQVWCWGCNASGEVGDGTTQPRAEPVHVL